MGIEFWLWLRDMEALIQAVERGSLPDRPADDEDESDLARALGLGDEG